MTDINGPDFLLQSETAKILFHDYAEKMPIADYHCHLDSEAIYKNKRFDSIAEAWLGGDHYKWRLMRACGVKERYITGQASDWEKFRAFAEILPRAVGNPVYHWVHLELRRYFGCDLQLNAGTAREVWDICNDKLSHDGSLRVRGIIESSGVEYIITTEDPTDSLRWHKKLTVDPEFDVNVLPGWRPDAAMRIEDAGYLNYLSKLGATTGAYIDDFDTLKRSLSTCMDHFAANGCVTSDHGISEIARIPKSMRSDDRVNDLFIRRTHGEILSSEEAAQFRCALLDSLAREYSKRGWVMQLHLGALRNVNTAMFKKLGPDTGFDCIDTDNCLAGLAGFLDDLNNDGALPKTLIFSIDPSDNMAVNTLAGCFSQTGVRSKVQQGAAWWFNDSFSGIERQLTDFAESGVLANFVGMLTDSRSFLSYVRHEYFRRILCSLLGKWADAGMCCSDTEYLGGMVQDICYNNAKDFFELRKSPYRGRGA